MEDEEKSTNQLDYMLTTIDNPFSPYTQFDDWKRFDEDRGYYTSEYLARIATTSSALSDPDYNAEIIRAIDEICKLNVLGIYKKIRPNEKPNPINVELDKNGEIEVKDEKEE